MEVTASLSSNYDQPFDTSTRKVLRKDGLNGHICIENVGVSIVTARLLPKVNLSRDKFDHALTTTPHLATDS